MDCIRLDIIKSRVILDLRNLLLELVLLIERLVDRAGQRCGWRVDAAYPVDSGSSICSVLSDRPRSVAGTYTCLLYTSPSPRDYAASRMPSSA